jgi:hypothetical protein
MLPRRLIGLTGTLLVFNVVSVAVLLKWIVPLTDSLTTLPALDHDVFTCQVPIFQSQGSDLAIVWVDVSDIREAEITGSVGKTSTVR